MTREEADMRALIELRDDLRLVCDARTAGHHSRQVQLIAHDALREADSKLTRHLRQCHGERPLVALDDDLGWRAYCPTCWVEARAQTMRALEGAWEERMDAMDAEEGGQ